MKKILFILLLFFVGFVFIGCKKTSDNKPDEGNIEDPNGGNTEDPNGGNTDDPNGENTEDPNGENTEDPVDEGFTVTFVLDSNVTVIVYATQSDMTEGVNGEVGTTAKSKDSDTGEVTSSDGQVNFVLSFNEGYELDTIEITGTYNKLKGSADTLIENGYRITKIQSDLTVTVKSKVAGQEENLDDGYLVSFTVPEGVTITTYPTQDFETEGTVDTKAYSRDSATGALTKTDGQVNFVLTLPLGYEVDEITIEGEYKNLKDLGNLGYRITKIAGELTVTITIKEKGEEAPSEGVSSEVFKSTYEEVGKELTVAISEGTFTYTYSDNVLVITPSADLAEASVSLTGEFNGTIKFELTDDQDLEIGLTNVTLYSTYTLPPILILTGNNIDISAKKGSTNFIYDKREAQEEYTAAVYVTSDLTLKGSGSLTVESTNNNGIHTKDDLEVKNLTLTVNCVDNALKGNDGVTITSGNLTLIARQGDGIKTSNSVKKYNDDGTLKKIQGTINISGGEVTIYAACDGIDASYDAVISGEAVLNIYTDKYSSYSEEVKAVSDSTMYIRNTSTAYKYSVYFYNSDTDYVWKNSSSYKTVQGGRTTYYYYEIEKPAGYSNLIVYIYNSSQEQGQSTNYYVKSSNATVNNNYDTFAYSSQRGTFSWTNYTTQTGPGGPGGFGGGGNNDKGDYSTKGIKADNEIVISGGTIYIKAYDDAIHANNDNVLGDEDDPNDDYKGLGNITISGGTLTLYSNDDAVHADQDLTVEGDANILVISSYEGFEANRIYVKGGVISAYATDDAFNAAKCNGSYTPLINITGGVIELATPSGDTDTMDSNGSVVISGGVLILKNGQNNGTSMTGGTIDLDGTLTITGGALISIGCWCNEAKVTCQVTNTSSTLSAGSYEVKDANGNVLASFTLSQSYKGYRMYFSGKSGTYTVYCNGSQVFTF